MKDKKNNSINGVIFFIIYMVSPTGIEPVSSP